MKLYDMNIPFTLTVLISNFHLIEYIHTVSSATDHWKINVDQILNNLC